MAELENSDIEEDGEQKQQQKNEVEASPESPISSSQPEKAPESPPPPSPKESPEISQELDQEQNKLAGNNNLEEQSRKSPQLESSHNGGVDVDANSEEQLTDSLTVDE